MNGKILIIIVSLIALAILSMPILLESQVMPGRLTMVHESGENDCGTCHDAFNGTPAKKCYVCHKEIERQALENRGLHSDFDNCSDCHREHRGRDYPLAEVLPENFTHAQTGFLLDEEHAHLGCESCHTDKKRLYTGLNPNCSSCHTDWAAGYGHKRINADFQTIHTELSCVECHLEGVIDPEPFDCENCHDESFFNDEFNHSAIGGVPLKDFHQGVTCQRCHSEGYFHLHSPYQCVDCHSGWNQSDFDHSTTGTPLDPLHQSVKCAGCHKSPADNFQKVSETCADCHTVWKTGREHKKLSPKFMKVHKGVGCNACHAFSKIACGKGNCNDCHTDKWITKNFKHSVTGFTLGDSHSGFDCDQCHTKGRQYSPPESACLQCHDKSDLKGVYPG